MATTKSPKNFTDALPIASEGDALGGADLTDQIQWLQDQATALNAEKKPGMSDKQISEIANQQEELRDKADLLTAVEVTWLAGRAKLEAEHIQSALDYAQKVIDKVASLKKKFKILTAVVTFFGVVLTGEPLAILKAGAKLKKDIDAAEKG